MQPELLGKSLTSHNTRSSKYTVTLKGVAFSDSDVRRFHAKVRRTDGCWLWTGSRSGSMGYGQFGVQTPGANPKQVNAYAHRIAWTLSRGPVPEDQFVLHSCDNPICVNPAHLFLGTHKHNMEDAAKKGRLHVNRPKRQKVTDAAIAEMHALDADGIARTEIARRFAVTKGYVSMVLNGTRRQHGRTPAA